MANIFPDWKFLEGEWLPGIPLPDDRSASGRENLWRFPRIMAGRGIPVFIFS
jgi:hypothetical protein